MSQTPTTGCRCRILATTRMTWCRECREADDNSSPCAATAAGQATTGAPMSDLIHAPWTCTQVDALNRWQEDDQAHPYTCTNRNDGEHRIGLNDDWGVLVATRDGWVCPDCDYRQDWAYAEMADDA